MFTIDFTKPWLYKDIIYFNQGNLSTNNTLRCKLVTGGSDDFTGGSIACTFTTKDSIEISGFGRLVDAKGGIVDIVFPSNALVVGTNKLEILVNRADGGVAQSPSVLYDIWQGLTTGNGVEAETNYPILIELINSTNEASNKANSALNKANSMITDITDAIDNAYRSANDADIATSNANSKIEEVETAKTEMIKQVDNSIANMKIETNTAINSMTAKTDEKITDVNIALAAGTKDLEVKEARKDANGVVHDTLDERLKSDLIVGDKSLKDFVIDMNGMKETQDLAYETDKDYLVCKDTINGVAKDLKVCGKSLVQVYPQLPLNEQNYLYNVGLNGVVKEGDYITVTGNGTHYIDAQLRFSKNELFKPSTEYTFFVEIVSNNMIGKFDFNVDYLNRSMFTAKFGIEEGFVGTKIIKATTKDIAWFNDNTIENKTILRTQASTLNTGSIKYRIWALEGSHDEVVPFFKGIASVGNGNEIEVLSRNKNIAKEIVAGTINTTTGEYMDNSNVNRLNKVRILPNTKYTFSKNNTPRACNKYFYDKDNKFIGTINGVDSTFITPTNAYYISLTWGTIIEDGNYQLEMGGIATSYVKPIEDKKPILFKDTGGTWKPVTELRGIDLNNCDSIENGLFNKLISLETVSDKNTFTLRSQDGGTLTNCFEVNEPLTNCNVSDTNFIGLCDKFKTYNWTGINGLVTSDEEGVTILSNKKIRFRILKSKANSVEELKTYLTNNNFNILRLLENKLTYEVNPLDLESFYNITLWLIRSGVIAPPASFKITSSLPNFVKNVDTRVKRMENDFYKYTVTQNRMQLGTTYSSDRTTFRVDTATFSTEKAKQDLDYDLFRLLKHNILVGPHNYDKAEMENMMDFYVSVGKIDYNMWDELYMLIEEQHNPPVEEEAPVI